MKSLHIMILAVGLTWAGCGNKERSKHVLAQVAVDTGQSIRQDISYSDPQVFLGSSFGSTFTGWIRAQQYDECLKYTSVGSFRKYGRKAILKLYAGLKVNYTLRLRSAVKKGRDTTMMRYVANEYATSKFKEFVVVVEVDTCRLVLPELNTFLK